jgi:hypothetical protein
MIQLKIKTLFLPVVLLLSLSSCLKKGAMNIDVNNGTKNVVQFANTGDNISGSSSTYPEFHIDLGSLANGASTTFNVNVSYSGVEVAPADITVNLSLDQTALTLYNTQNGTSYVIPPSDVFSLPASAVIKKGTREAQIQVKITNTINFDFNASYALPVQIASASMGIVSANFGKAVYSFGLRNIYDGHYTVTPNSPMVDYASGALTGNYPMDVYLETTGANSVVLIDNLVGSPSHTILVGGSSISYYGAYAPVFNFDPSGNGTIVSVVNYYGQPSGNGRSAQLDPSGINKWVPGSKVMDVNYWMNQPAVITPHRVSFSEHFTYVGPR